MRVFRVLRVVKVFRYLESLQMIAAVSDRQFYATDQGHRPNI